MRRDAKSRTILQNLDFTYENSEEILQGKALVKLRKCLSKVTSQVQISKGYLQSTPDLQAGLIEFLKITFPQFKYLFRLLAKEGEPKKQKIFNLFQSMKIIEKNKGFSILNEFGSFDYMYILLAGSVEIQTKREIKQQSIEMNITKPVEMKPLKKKLLSRYLQGFTNSLNQTMQTGKMLKNDNSVQVIEEQKAPRMVNIYTLFGDKIKALDGSRFTQIVVNEDFTELIQAPIKIFQKAFLDELDLQEVREQVKALKQWSYFSEINSRVLSHLIVNSEIITITRGQYLYKQDDVLDWKAEEKRKKSNIFFYILRVGTLRVTRTTKISFETKESVMNQKIKKHETDVCLLSEGQLVGMEEIINQSQTRFVRMHSVLSNSNESQLYQIPISEIREKLQKVMTSQSKTKDLIQEFVSRKLSVEEELGQKIKQRTLTTYYPTFSKTASEINFEDFKLDYKEESLPHINFDYQDSSTKQLNRTLGSQTKKEEEMLQKGGLKAQVKEEDSMQIRSRLNSDFTQDQYSSIIWQKSRILSSIRMKASPKKSSNEKFGEFNFTKDLYNVRTLQGSNQILDRQTKQQSKHQSQLGYVSQKLSRKFSTEMNLRSDKDLSLIALNRYVQRTLSREKKRSRQWQSLDASTQEREIVQQSQAMLTLKRKLKRSRKERQSKMILQDNRLKIENKVILEGV